MSVSVETDTQLVASLNARPDWIREKDSFGTIALFPAEERTWVCLRNSGVDSDLRNRLKKQNKKHVNAD